MIVYVICFAILELLFLIFSLFVRLNGDNVCFLFIDTAGRCSGSDIHGSGGGCLKWNANDNTAAGCDDDNVAIIECGMKSHYLRALQLHFLMLFLLLLYLLFRCMD